MVFVVLLYVEIHRTVALVGVTIRHDLFHQLFLLNDVSRGMWLNAGTQHVQRIHGRMISVGIKLCYLHRFELLQASLLLDFVIPLVGIVFQMAYVRDVTHIAHLVPQVLEITKKNVERNGRTRMSQVRITVNRGTTHIHTHVGGMQWFEKFLLAGQRIVDKKFLFHKSIVLISICKVTTFQQKGKRV